MARKIGGCSFPVSFTHEAWFKITGVKVEPGTCIRFRYVGGVEIQGPWDE